MNKVRLLGSVLMRTSQKWRKFPLSVDTKITARVLYFKKKGYLMIFINLLALQCDYSTAYTTAAHGRRQDFFQVGAGIFFFCHKPSVNS